MRMRKEYRPELCCGKDDRQGRDNLTQPFLDKERKVIVATDGHCLAVLPVEIDPDDPVYVNREAIEYARRSAFRSQGDIQILRGEQVTALLPGPTFPLDTYSRTMVPPDYRGAAKIRPVEDKECVTVGLNVDLLVKVARAMGTKHVALVICKEYPDFSPICVHPADPHDGEPVGVVMPLRIWRKR